MVKINTVVLLDIRPLCSPIILSILPRNVGLSPHYTALQHRRLHLHSQRCENLKSSSSLLCFVASQWMIHQAPCSMQMSSARDSWSEFRLCSYKQAFVPWQSPPPPYTTLLFPLILQTDIWAVPLFPVSAGNKLLVFVAKQLCSQDIFMLRRRWYQNKEMHVGSGIMEIERKWRRCWRHEIPLATWSVRRDDTPKIGWGTVAYLFTSRTCEWHGFDHATLPNYHNNRNDFEVNLP
jgi:hypothetical protein